MGTRLGPPPQKKGGAKPPLRGLLSVFWDGLLESRPRRNFRCRAVVVVRQGAVASKGGAPLTRRDRRAPLQRP